MTAASLRAFADADLEPVLALRARAFGTPATAAERICWRWEYADNPFHDPGVPLGWVAEVAGGIAGYYGMVPLPARVDGRVGLALCGADFCVDAAHRQSGIGMLLTRRFLDTTGALLHFVTSATPAAAAMMRYYRAAMIDPRREPCLWLALLPPTGSDERQPPLGDGDLGDARLRGAIDAFDAQLGRAHRAMVVRDHRYLSWRYGTFPFAAARPRLRTLAAADGTLRGILVFQFDPALRRAYACELLHLPGDTNAIAALATDALALARAAGANELYAFLRGDAARATMPAHGFRAVAAGDTGPLVRLPAGGPGPADWFLGAGDGDFLFRIGASRG